MVDMHASPTGYAGYILLSIQVLLGYILLGALITRFSVMFNADGPAQKLNITIPSYKQYWFMLKNDIKGLGQLIKNRFRR